MSSVAEPGRPIAAAILALVVGAVVTATIVYFFVTFSGPPPKAPPRGLESVAAALATGEQPGDPGPSLRVYRSATPPTPGHGLIPDPVAREQMAAQLGVPPRIVVALTDGPQRFDRAFLGHFLFALRSDDGWQVVESPPPPLLTRWHVTTLLAMLLTIALLALPAWAIARAISRPLKQAARAAEQARAGAERPAFPAGGPSEVRALSAAMAAMHDRLTHHAEARTAMLAAIAHDLGTPLSRLAFWIEQLPDAARDRATADIDEMRAMIGDTLRFARGEAGERDAALVDLDSLLDSLVEDMAVGGAAVTLTPGPRAVVRGDPRALRRLFANLVGNALRYGGSAAVGWSVTAGEAVIEIADTGGGIDPAQAERLFDPFVRGEASRNRATGGTGLGLAIVRSIAARHGGTATLANRTDAPGAVARVTLPLA